VRDVAVDPDVLQPVRAAPEAKREAITKCDHLGLAIEDHLAAPVDRGPSDSIMAQRAVSYYRYSAGMCARSHDARWRALPTRAASGVSAGRRDVSATYLPAAFSPAMTPAPRETGTTTRN
jgi:hypothetical protein